MPLDADELKERIAELRGRWRAARDGRLSRKKDLLAGGMDAAGVRHDRTFRALVKQQRRAGTLIRQLEKKLNRKIAREKE